MEKHVTTLGTSLLVILTFPGHITESDCLSNNLGIFLLQIVCFRLSVMVKLLDILADFLSESLSGINNAFWDIPFLNIACFYILISFKTQTKKH